MILMSKRFKSDPRLQQVSNNRPWMKTGEKGEPVRKIQQTLIDFFGPGTLADSTRKWGVVDGDFGSETRKYVKKFQFKKHLDDDGIVGEKTLDEMDRFLRGTAFDAKPVPGLPTAFDEEMRKWAKDILQLSSAAVLQFSMGGKTLNFGELFDVGTAIEKRRIHVRMDPAMMSGNIGGVYIGASDEIRLPTFSSKHAHRSRLVHEAVHAAFDARGSGTITKLEEEAMAFTAQCMFLQHETGSETVPGSSFSWKPIAEAAYPLAAKLRNSQSVSQSEFDGLVNAIKTLAPYSSFGAGDRYVHDGV